MKTITLNEGMMLTGGLLGAAYAGRVSYLANNKKIITAGYCLGAFAISFALTDAAMRKTKIQENRGGFDGIEVGIYLAGGAILLLTTFVANKFLKN